MFPSKVITITVTDLFDGVSHKGENALQWRF